MNQTIQVDGYPVQITTRTVAAGFRAEISTSPDADDQTANQLFERATSWSRQLSAGRENSSVHCFRDGRDIVVEDLARKASDTDMQGLIQYLQSPSRTAAAGSGETNEGAPALTG